MQKRTKCLVTRPNQLLHGFAKMHMMTSSNGNIFRVTGPLCGEFTGPGEFPTQRPVTRSFDVFFDLRLNKRSRKQPWGWWFETLSSSLWRHCKCRCKTAWPFLSHVLFNIPHISFAKNVLLCIIMHGKTYPLALDYNCRANHKILSLSVPEIVRRNLLD